MEKMNELNTTKKPKIIFKEEAQALVLNLRTTPGRTKVGVVKFHHFEPNPLSVCGSRRSRAG
jgi:hypothetical protein